MLKKKTSKEWHTNQNGGYHAMLNKPDSDEHKFLYTHSMKTVGDHLN